MVPSTAEFSNRPTAFLNKVDKMILLDTESMRKASANILIRICSRTAGMFQYFQVVDMKLYGCIGKCDEMQLTDWS